MGIYEQEMKSNKDWSTKWKKRIYKYVIFLPIVTFIIIYLAINLIACIKMNEANTYMSDGDFKEAVFALDCPMDFLISIDKYDQIKQAATTAYIPVLISELDALIAKNTPKGVLLNHIIINERYLSPNQAFNDKVSSILTMQFGNELQTALNSNNIESIQLIFNKIDTSIHTDSQQLFLENTLMEKVVSLLNNNDGSIALSLLEQFDNFFEKENNSRIETFIDSEIKFIEHGGDLLMQDNTLKINSQDISCTFFSNDDFNETANKTNLYFSYYVENDASNPTYLNVTADANIIFEKNANNVDGIQKNYINIQDKKYSIKINQPGAYFFYIYEYSPITSYSIWVKEVHTIS